MPSLKMSLPGLFKNVARSIPIRDGRDQYVACLEEVQKHIEETIQGEHTLAEFAEHYCLPAPPPATASPERIKNLLGKFLDAWNMGEEPDARDIEEARRICIGSTLAEPTGHIEFDGVGRYVPHPQKPRDP